MDMVDVERRRRAAFLVARFRNALITYDEFEEAYPIGPNDRALFAVFMEVWPYHDDFNEPPRRDLPEVVVQRLRRCELFLNSGLPYEWPRWYLNVAFLLLPLNILTLGLLGRLLRMKFERSGDVSVWPFVRRADYERVLHDAARLP